MNSPRRDRRSFVRYTRLAVALLASLSMGTPVVAVAAAGPVEDWGYLTVRDGTRLRYTVVQPEATGEFPVALIYSPYVDGVGPTQDYPIGEDPEIANALLDAGYAVVGVNIRGTGCSGGQWDLFRPVSDGYDVVEWAASQPWSTGDVGMFGFSAPGMSQLLTASTRPPHLRAITPADVATDLYRDVAYPGGVMNSGFLALWTAAYRPGVSHLSAVATAQGDAECLANIAARQVNDELRTNDAWEMLTAIGHPYDDQMWAEYGLQSKLGAVDVPVLTCQAWQDDQVGSRAGSFYYDKLDRTRTWMVFTNGAHGTCDDFVPSPFKSRVVRFFDRYVKGQQNGFDTEPHVQIWHETTGVLYDALSPRWITHHVSWPVPVKARTLYLREGGRLDTGAPGILEGADSYTYPLPSSSADDSEFQQSHLGWKIPNAPLGSVAYTSPALAKDLEVFGTASLDVWLKSTAPDTDIQVTLTEIRPDGQEMYVQRGWLRASHRAVDGKQSTAVRPYHTHAASDGALLTPGLPTLVRVEVNPFGHVFRKGSALRVYIEAPTGLTGERAFNFIGLPAVNSVLHDRAYPSKLVLGAVKGTAPVALAPCDTTLSQPCRTNDLPVPGGSLTLPDV